MNTAILIVIIGAILVGLSPLLIMFLIGVLFIRKVGPNEVMIIYGYGGTKIITGGSHIVYPRLQTTKCFSLEVMSFTVALLQELYLNEPVMSVHVEATVLITVNTSEPDAAQVLEQLQGKEQLTREDMLRTLNENTAEQSVYRAIVLFLDKNQHEREELIRGVIEGHLRGLIVARIFEELVKEYEEITQVMFKIMKADLDRMGLEMVSFTIKGIRPAELAYKIAQETRKD
jgi:flotillin